MKKDMTLRLDTVQAAELDMVAAVDGHHVSTAVRIAISEYIERRRDAPDFQRRLRENIERMRRMVTTDPVEADETLRAAGYTVLTAPVKTGRASLGLPDQVLTGQEQELPVFEEEGES